jgi:hypothetical protein
MSYDLTIYLDAECGRAALVSTFASSQPAHALEVRRWDAEGGQMLVTLRADGKGRRAAPNAISELLEVTRRRASAPTTLDVPKSSRKKLAEVRMAYALSVSSEPETAAAWALASTLALAGGGFVDDPQDGVTSTASQASKRAARIIRGALSGRSGPSLDDDHLSPEDLESERRAMFAASLRRHLEAGTVAGFVAARSLDAELLREGLAVTVDADRSDATFALAMRAPPEILTAHAAEAARAPGLRSRIYFEHLIRSGALDGFTPETLREIVASLTTQREPELVALLRDRVPA